MSADRSQTERIRRLKGQLQAVRRAECPTCPEEGPRPPTDDSTRLSRMFGQMEYTRLNAVGARITTCCGATASQNTSQQITERFEVGTTDWLAPATVTSITYLIVGGGGGGGGAKSGARGGGGGGGGLVRIGTFNVTPGQTYTVIVGTGGLGAVQPADPTTENSGSPGNQSSFDIIIAGGGGFGNQSSTAGGGGAAASGTTPPRGGNGNGTPGPGKSGSGGGGNTSGGYPADYPTVGTGGPGGTGLASSITGSLVTYGAGGAGGTAGSNSSGTPGQENTGNGGQGGGSVVGNNIGGANGGSGIVVITYNN